MDKLQVIITTTLSLLTLIFLYKQYRNQRYRVKMDLFDKRFKVYSHVRKFIWMGSQGGTKLEVVQEFLSNIPEHEFIFDNEGEIVKYIDDLWKKGLDLYHFQEDIKNLNSYPVGSHERDQLIEEKRPYREFFTREYEQVKYRFSKYLHLGEVEEENHLSRLFNKIRKQTVNYLF
ncbi:MAG: hypothetical protein NT040_03330 [Bacteroidetes bacterium]|nr:hypothetical protein [Bacteroidota bacterium]